MMRGVEDARRTFAKKAVDMTVTNTPYRKAARPDVVAHRATASGAVALGAVALGALALGALAIGAIAIGRLSVGRARIRSLEIDELTVRNLRLPPPLRKPWPR
jgi:hypothetical protein